MTKFGVRFFRTIWTFGLPFIAACGISGGSGGPSVKTDDEFSIQNVEITTLTDSLAVLEWTTTESAVCTALYGVEAALLPFTRPSALGTGHDATFDPLDEDTIYYYQISCANGVGERVVTTVDQFHTPFSGDHSDLTPPVITNVSVSGITPTSVTVNWTTDDRSHCQIHFGLDPFYGLTYTEPTNAFARQHAAVLTSLTDDELYHFRIQARNRANLTSSTEDQTFHTAAFPTLYIDPPSITVGPNQEFEFRVAIRDAQNLAGLEFQVTYPASRVEVLSLRAGPYCDSVNGGFMFLNKNPQTNFPLIGDATWRIEYERGVATGAASGSSGVIAVVRARAKNLLDDNVVLTIDTSVEAQDPDAQPKTRLLDHHRNDIPVNVRNGIVVISS